MVDVRERRLLPADLLNPHGSMAIHYLGSRLRLLAGCENYDPAALNPFDIRFRVRLDDAKAIRSRVKSTSKSVRCSALPHPRSPVARLKHECPC